jgi:protein TonB
MFDLITGKAEHVPGGGTGPVIVSSAIHLGVLVAIITVPLLLMRQVLPEVPTMMAFVVSAPAPPPPPPPPAAPIVRKAVAQPTGAPVSSPDAAPVEAPSEVRPEAAVAAVDEGVPGGVEGGVPEGVLGGIVGGLPEAPPPPPPPPPPPAAPVRVGGQIKQPTLVTRVEPIYPNVAVQAHIEGVVILEATVDAHGRVTNLKVLRGMPLLERAAVDAVMQWRYSPVILNGTPVPFILTVVVQFSLPEPRKSAAY